jgi:ribonuclease R
VFCSVQYQTSRLCQGGENEFVETSTHPFDGVITGVTDWGIYVQEKGSLANGMVRLSSIRSDYFEHEAKKYRIKGKKTGKTYRLGDEVKVKLLRADKDERQLDFELITK